MPKFLILLLVSIFSVSIIAQTISYQNYDSESNFGSDISWTIYKDKRGFIWAGPTGMGAVGFDGKNFYKFTEKDGLAGKYVISFLHDKYDRMWFGCQGQGISIYDGNKFYNFSVEDSIGMTSNNILSMHETKNGSIYFGTFAGGILKFDGIKIQLLENTDGASFYDFVEDQNGILWVGTRDSGIAKIQNDKVIYLNEEINLPKKIILDIELSNEGDLFICSSKGLFKYAIKNGKAVQVQVDGLPEKYSANNCVQMSDGSLYLSTNEGHYFIENNVATKINYHGNINHDFTRMVKDHNNFPWASSNGSGIVRLIPNNIKIISTPDKKLHSLALDERGHLYLGTSNGIYEYSGDNYEKVVQRVKLSEEHSEPKWILMKDSTSFYIGLQDQGLFYNNGKDENIVKLSSSESFAAVWKDDENIQMFGVGNIFEYNITTKQQKWIKPLGLEPLFFAATKDSEGSVWAGTYESGHIFKMTEKDTVVFTQDDGLTNGAIIALKEDHRKRMWFLTIDGYFGFYNGTKFKTYSPVVDNEVYSFAHDLEGNMWLSGQAGIIKIAFQNDEIKSVKILGKNDGVSNEITGNGQSLQLPDNRLVFPKGNNKAYIFDPNKVVFQNETPKVYISGISGRDDIQLDDAWSNDHVGFFQIPKNLILPYTQNNLNVQVSAVYFSNPDSLKYTYLLEGYDEDWSNPKNEGEIYFTNLPSENYKLKIKAIAGDTESEIIEFEFKVETPWFLTWWFYVLCILSAGLFIWLIFRWRLTSMRKEQLRLELIVRQRTREVIYEKEIVEEKNKAILDSINYAKRLQNAILPTEEKLINGLKDYFLFYQPKDIVSGDFYWFEEQEDYYYLAVADCTGHGVPGAMVSTVCANALNKSLHELNKKSPAEILNSTRDLVIEHFSKGADAVNDGMDIALIRIDKKSNELVYSGANNPVWIYSSSAETVELIQLNPNKQPVGKHTKFEPFTEKKLPLQKGDIIYLSSDGYQDQFGGDKGKKFKATNLKKFLYENHQKSMAEQCVLLTNQFKSWTGDFEQVDDVCVIGVRLTQP